MAGYHRAVGDVVQSTLAQDYPSQPITLIVPHAPAAGVDILSRILAERMKATLRQAIVVKNLPTGAVGRLAEATADGYTIGIGDQTSFVISSVTTSVRYDVFKDFDPIALLSTSPVVLIARRTMQASDLKELIVWLKETPEGATAGSFGQGSGPNIIRVAFQSLTGTKLRMVTYRGNAPALQDVVSGVGDGHKLRRSLLPQCCDASAHRQICSGSTGGWFLHRPFGGQTGYPSVPVGVALVGVGDFEDLAFAEWAPLDLEADRQAITVEATGRAYRRQPKVVDGARVDADGAEGLDGARCTGVDVSGS